MAQLEIEHYEGYVIAESMINDNNSIPKPIWDIKVKVMEKILKSQNNEK